MPTFKNYKYTRPDLKHVKDEFRRLLARFDQAASVDAQNELIREINTLRNHFETMATLAYIRYSIDTTDKYCETENNFMDEAGPIYEGLVDKYYRSLVTSKFRDDLEKKWGRHLFTIAELKLKTFSPEIIVDLQEENKLVSKYTKLRASARIMFEGEERNLSQMGPFMEAEDRVLRKRAHEKYTAFFAEHEEQFDQIYDELVKLRHGIAKKLGYENFVELGYVRLARSDYNQEMVSGYREQVLKDLVPVTTELRKRQAKRLQLDSLKYYDETLTFPTGNPLPKGNPDQLISYAGQMYNQLSPETGEFFTYMVKNELMDLLAKEGKAGGGYCTYIHNYQAPFIFANFNGTSGDVDVLTHEAGHAFQVFSSKNYEIPEYIWPTLEACEIHSMSMEFLTWPWMNLFFQEEADKYKFAHLSNALLFIPYGVTVDEFQHWVYENPQATPCQRRGAWRKIEEKYLVHRDYADNDFLEQGGYWFRQGHIFSNPFYYIDYTLAQVCAFQFWAKVRRFPKKAWENYLRLCKAGGSKSFLKLVELAELNNPFNGGIIQSTLQPIKAWLNQVNENDFS